MLIVMILIIVMIMIILYSDRSAAGHDQARGSGGQPRSPGVPERLWARQLEPKWLRKFKDVQKYNSFHIPTTRIET